MGVERERGKIAWLGPEILRTIRAKGSLVFGYAKAISWNQKIVYSTAESVTSTMLVYTFMIARTFSNDIIIIISYVHPQPRYRRSNPLRKHQVALVCAFIEVRLQRLYCEDESQLKEQAGSELFPVHEQAHARNIGRGAEPPVVSGISTAYSGFAGWLQTSPWTSPVELTTTLPVM